MKNLTDDEVLGIYEKGHACAENGGSYEECPYAKGSYERDRWMLGYADQCGDTHE